MCSPTRGRGRSSRPASRRCSKTSSSLRAARWETRSSGGDLANGACDGSTRRRETLCAARGAHLSAGPFELAARESIRDLVARYNANGDSGRFDAVMALFAEDATLELEGEILHGGAAIRAFFERVAERTRSTCSPKERLAAAATTPSSPIEALTIGVATSTNTASLTAGGSSSAAR